MFTFEVKSIWLQWLLQWLCSFITNRRQRVVINGYSSDWSPVLSGLPQGSILGLLFFILHINGLPSAVCSPMKIFADDVAIYVLFSSESNTDCSA